LLAVSNLAISCHSKPRDFINDTLRIVSVVAPAKRLVSETIVFCASRIFLDMMYMVIHIIGINDKNNKAIIRLTKNAYQITKRSVTDETNATLIIKLMNDCMSCLAFWSFCNSCHDCVSSNTRYGSQNA